MNLELERLDGAPLEPEAIDLALRRERTVVARNSSRPPGRHNPPAYVVAIARDETQRMRLATKQRAKREEAAARVNACQACDDSGWILGENGAPIEPLVRCEHVVELEIVA